MPRTVPVTASTGSPSSIGNSFRRLPHAGSEGDGVRGHTKPPCPPVSASWARIEPRPAAHPDPAVASAVRLPSASTVAVPVRRSGTTGDRGRSDRDLLDGVGTPRPAPHRRRGGAARANRGLAGQTVEHEVVRRRRQPAALPGDRQPVRVAASQRRARRRARRECPGHRDLRQRGLHGPQGRRSGPKPRSAAAAGRGPAPPPRPPPAAGR